MTVTQLIEESEIRRERALPLQHGTNFRDFGGYATGDGRQVQWGRLYRSGHMSYLSDTDRQLLASLDIRVCCDFRREEEAVREPSRLPDTTRIVHVSISPGSASDFFDYLRAGHASPTDMAEFMEYINAEFVLHHQQAYSGVLDELQNLDGGALLINCSAGKDRTGFGAAVILMALGVSRETILEDYMLSERYYPIERELDRIITKYGPEAGGNLDAALVRPMMETRREYIQRAFDTIDEHFGGDEAYLEQQYGLNANKRARLRERYTT